MASWLSSAAWAESDRGGVIENRHLIHASVVDASGRLIFSFGDPSRPTLLRSAAKPAQALAILESGCFDLFPFDDADLALMCASHSSEEFHVSRARDMLGKIGGGVTEEHLQCGGHPPLSDRVHREWIKNDYEPTGLCNNCSGKHVGMIAATIALGADVRTYHTPDGPTHARVKEVVEDVAGLAGHEDQVKWGVDGCNLPAPAMPLQHLAGMYASFAASVDAVESNSALDGVDRVGQSGSNSTERAIGIGATPATHHDIASLPTPIPTPSPSPAPTPVSVPCQPPNPSSSPTPRVHHMSRIFLAMNTHPELVGGTARFCTVLMRSFPGLLIGKLGADGCYGIGIRSSPQTRAMGADGAVGLGVKIEDGNVEVLYAVLVEILVQLGLLDEARMCDELKAFWKLERRNTMGVITGRVTMPFKLRVGGTTQG